MPTYEYTCKKCGQNLEVFQSFTDKPLKKHTECGGELQKVFHARGIVFKGSGFYATDSKGSINSKTSSDTESTTKKSEGKSTTTETKKTASSTSSKDT